MKINILIIGKNSFLSTNLFKYFRKRKVYVKKIGFNEFLQLEEKKILKYDTIINCSINSLYFKKNIIPNMIMI